MSVIVDTTIWSLALRRSPRAISDDQRRLLDELAELIRVKRARLLGPVRQEVLSGIHDERAFERVRGKLRAFDDLELAADDYESAAKCHARCRARGVAGTPVDLLICAVAMRRGFEVFSTDRDFEHYARVLPIVLHVPASRDDQT